MSTLRLEFSQCSSNCLGTCSELTLGKYSVNRSDSLSVVLTILCHTASGICPHIVNSIIVYLYTLHRAHGKGVLSTEVYIWFINLNLMLC